jgi:hypothetical protein
MKFYFPVKITFCPVNLVFKLDNFLLPEVFILLQ